MKNRFLVLLLSVSMVFGNITPIYAEPVSGEISAETVPSENQEGNEELPEEDSSFEEGSVSGDTVSEDEASPESVSKDSVSEDVVSEDSVSNDDVRNLVLHSDDSMEPIFIELSPEEAEEGAELASLEEDMMPESYEYNNEWDRYTSYYAYNKLNDSQRALWDYWASLCNSYLYGKNKNADITHQTLSGVYNYFGYTKVTTEAFSTYSELGDFIEIFRYSNPQYFFLGNSYVGYSSSESGYYYIGLVLYDNFIDGTARAAAAAQIDQSIESYYSDSSVDGKTGEELVHALHNLECETVSYNYVAVNTSHANEESEYTQSSYSALAMDYTVCAGYSLAFSMLCNGKGVECLAMTGPGHAWNKVWVDGSWYNIDVTNGDQSYGIYYKYYLKSNATYQDSSDSFSAHHVDDDFWSGYVPECLHDSDSTSWVHGGVDEPLGTASAPVITISGTKATITAEGSDSIYYTVGTDEQDPSAASTKSKVYKKEITVDNGDVIKAVAVKDQYNNSSVAQKTADVEVAENKTVIAGQTVDLTERMSLSEPVAKYALSNKSIAKVSKSGILTAKKAGDVTVTAYSKSGKTYIPMDSLTVHIEKPSFVIAEKGIVPGQQIDAASCITGTTEEPSYYTITGSLATISENGVITLTDSMRSGKVKVTAYYEGELNTAKYTASLTIKKPKLKSASASLKVGSATQMKISNPGAAITYSSDDPTIATVSDTGLITGTGVGQTTVHATIKGYNFDCSVSVIYPVQKLIMTADQTTLSLSGGDTAVMTLGTTPEFENFYDDMVTWSTSSSKVATVENGVVTPHQAGKATITAAYMGKKASVKVKVVP